MTTKLNDLSIVKSVINSTPIGGTTPDNATVNTLTVNTLAAINYIQVNNTAASSSKNNTTQGSYIEWNYPAASGQTIFVNKKGSGQGGFVFYNHDGAVGTYPGTMLGYFDYTGTWTAANNVIASTDLWAGGTNATGTVHAAFLTGYAQGQFTKGSNASGNWIKELSSGLIRQWGSAGAGSNPVTVTFPTAFTSAGSVGVVFASQNYGTGATRNVAYLTAAPSLTSFTAQTDSSSCAFQWMAIGY